MLTRAGAAALLGASAILVLASAAAAEPTTPSTSTVKVERKTDRLPHGDEDRRIPIATSLPTTAKAFRSSHCCNQLPGHGPYRDRDVWVFALRTGHHDHAKLRKVKAQFRKDSSTYDLVIEAGGKYSDIVRHGSGYRAWIVLPKGLSLVDATAVVGGKAKEFVLEDTCPAQPGGDDDGSSEPVPVPVPVPSGSSSPSTSPSPRPTSSSSPSPSTPAPTPSASNTGGTGGGSESGGTLPVTGSALTGILVAGGTLLTGGVAAVATTRRRRLAAIRVDRRPAA